MFPLISLGLILSFSGILVVLVSLQIRVGSNQDFRIWEGYALIDGVPDTLYKLRAMVV